MSSKNRRKFRRKLSQVRTRRAMMMETLESRELLAVTPLEVHVYDGTNNSMATADAARGSSITAAPSNPIGDNGAGDTTLIAHLGSNGGSQRFPGTRQPVPAPGGGDSYAVFIVGEVKIDNTNNPGGMWRFGSYADDNARIRIDLNQNGILEGSLNSVSGETVSYQGGCCNDSLGTSIAIPDGRYLMEMVFTEGGGGDYGEFYYGPGNPGTPVNSTNWSLIGQDDKGITLDLNEAPVINDLDSDLVNYGVPGSGPIALDLGGNATISDADSPANFDGASLTISYAAGAVQPTDALVIPGAGANVIVSGTTIGTIDGTDNGQGVNNLLINFNTNATPALVNTLIQTIRFDDGGASLIPTRVFDWTFDDGNGDTDTAQTTMSIDVGGAVVTHVWEGDVNTDWNTGGNWNTGNVPDANDVAIFNGTATSSTVNLNSPNAHTTFPGIQFVGTVQLDAGGFLFEANGSLVPKLIDQSAGNNEIASHILGADTVIDVDGGELTLSDSTNELAPISVVSVGAGAQVIANATTSESALGDSQVVLDGGTLELVGQVGTELGGVLSELEVWLDAADIDGDGNPDTFTNGQEFGTGGGQINGWQDKSGHDRDFDGMRNTPTFNTSSTHGGPAVHFDGGANELMWMNASHNPRSFIDGNGEFTLISVARYAAANERERVIAARTGHNWLFGFHGNRTNRGGHYDGWGSLDAQPVGGVTDENWHLHSNRMNVFGDATNPFGVWYRDGIELDQRGDGRGTGNSFNNNVPDGLALGGWDIGNGNREDSTSEVSELIMYNRVLSENELFAVENYLNAKYSLGLPVHPIAAIGIETSLNNDITISGDSTVVLTNVNEASMSDLTLNSGAVLNVDGNGNGVLEFRGDGSGVVINGAGDGVRGTAPDTQLNTLNSTGISLNNVGTTTADVVVNEVGDGTVILASANDNNDATWIVGGGTLELQDADALGDVVGSDPIIDAGRLLVTDVALSSNQVILNGGTLDANGISSVNNVTVTADSNMSSGTSLAINGTTDLGANELSFIGNGNVSINGDITGTGSTVKDGTGTITITVPTSYSGTTTVNNGVFALGGAGTPGDATGGTTVNDGGTLLLNGIIGPVDIGAEDVTLLMLLSAVTVTLLTLLMPLASSVPPFKIT